MPEKTSFCERIVCIDISKDKGHIDMCDNNNTIITDSFDDFVTRSFEFSYLWFYKA